eukprot:3710735-Pyramimonas_sp.AAC.1
MLCRRYRCRTAATCPSKNPPDLQPRQHRVAPRAVTVAPQHACSTTSTSAEVRFVRLISARGALHDNVERASPTSPHHITL